MSDKIALRTVSKWHKRKGVQFKDLEATKIAKIPNAGEVINTLEDPMMADIPKIEVMPYIEEALKQI